MGNFVDQDGDHVNVGNSGDNRPNVNNWYDNKRNDNIGLAASRKSVLCQNKRFPLGNLLFLARSVSRLEPAAQHAPNLVY